MGWRSGDKTESTKLYMSVFQRRSILQRVHLKISLKPFNLKFSYLQIRRVCDSFHLMTETLEPSTKMLI